MWSIDFYFKRYGEFKLKFQTRNIFIRIITKVCDGNSDCPNGFDELNSICSEVQCEFKCQNNECTLNKYVCDGYSQCTDGSDETNCTSIPVKIYDSKKCNENEFECHESVNTREKH